MLEEYFHVIREDRGGETDAGALVQTLCQALQLAAGTLDVTQWERERNRVRRETVHDASTLRTDAMRTMALAALISRRASTWMTSGPPSTLLLAVWC